MLGEIRGIKKNKIFKFSSGEVMSCRFELIIQFMNEQRDFCFFVDVFFVDNIYTS